MQSCPGMLLQWKSPTSLHPFLTFFFSMKQQVALAPAEHQKQWQFPACSQVELTQELPVLLALVRPLKLLARRFSMTQRSFISSFMETRLPGSVFAPREKWQVLLACALKLVDFLVCNELPWMSRLLIHRFVCFFGASSKQVAAHVTSTAK